MQRKRQESNKECRRLLSEQGVPHIYGDATELIDTSGIPLASMDYFQRRVAIQASPMVPCQHCYVCNGLCTSPMVCCDMSGPPCQSFSANGLRQGVQSLLVIVHMIWLPGVGQRGQRSRELYETHQSIQRYTPTKAQSTSNLLC